MAVIENAATSPEALAAWRASMRCMDRAELMAQQLVQRGAEHALAALQGAGVTPESCAVMLASLREGLIEIHTVAVERGIRLVGYSDHEPTTAVAPAPEIVAEMQQKGEPPKAFDAFLCRAWGETELPSVEIVRDWEGVFRFMVREWLGAVDATDEDGKVTLDRLKADFDEHDEAHNGRGGSYEWAFEIGGVSIERVVGFADTASGVAKGATP